MHGTNVDPRELALQIVDIVALRPEIDLCYMGIASKCFEILENRRSSEAFDRPESHLGMNGGTLEDEGAGPGSDGDEDDDDDDGDEDVEDEAVEDGSGDTESDEDDEEDVETDDETGGTESGRGTARLRLREILFYDDKVAIFKARHGRL